MGWVEKNLYSFRKSPMRTPIIGMKTVPKGAALVKRTPKTPKMPLMRMGSMMPMVISETEIESLPSAVAEKMMKIMSRPDIMKAMAVKKPKKKSPKKKSTSSKQKGGKSHSKKEKKSSKEWSTKWVM
jgi:hypothetical protein